MPTFSNAKIGAAITVKVTPRAKKTEVAGLMEDGTVKIRVAAPPEEGKANTALVEFLAKALNIPTNQIDIMGGLSSDRKLISLIGVSPGDVETTMTRLAAVSSKAKAAGKATKPKKKSTAANNKNKK